MPVTAGQAKKLGLGGGSGWIDQIDYRRYPAPLSIESADRFALRAKRL